MALQKLKTEADIPINKDNKLECLKFIAQTHRLQFDVRCRHEWKILFTALAFYVLVVFAVYEDKTPLNFWLKIIIWVIFLALSLSTSIWLAHINMANNKNKTFAENAEQSIDKLILTGEDPVKPVFSLEDSKYWVSWKKIKNKEGRWNWCWQVIILFAFSITAAILVTLKNDFLLINDTLLGIL